MKNYPFDKYKNIDEWEIETDEGFKPFRGIAKTEKQKCVKIMLDGGVSIICSKNHILFTDIGLKKAKLLRIGDFLKTSSGFLSVVKIKKIRNKIKLYEPINVGSLKNSYFSNFILSHNSFLGSASTLIEPQMISNFSHSIPLTEIPEQFQKFQTSVSFFELPKEDHIYALGIDMARMTEKNSGDPMAIQILDITKLPYIQVCRFWIKENINYLRIPEIAVSFGNFYNKALIFIENNDIGLEIGNMIHFEYEYESMYFEKDLPGFRTTPKTKRLGCVNLKSLIESNKLILNDFDTISELSTFIQKGKSFQAEHGKSDDLIMALIASIFFVQCPNLDLFDSRRSFYEQVLKTNDETPFFGIIDDGVNVYDDRNIF